MVKLTSAAAKNGGTTTATPRSHDEFAQTCTLRFAAVVARLRAAPTTYT